MLCDLYVHGKFAGGLICQYLSLGICAIMQDLGNHPVLVLCVVLGIS